MHPFKPLYGEKTTSLILGSWPSPKSRAAGFYYGHPQNRFWPMLAAIYGEAVPQDTEEKSALILRHHLALWDSLAACEITGASDASIKNAKANDIAALVAKTGAKQVLCNGAASYNYCVKYNTLAVPVYKMPSTSPANAAMRLDALVDAWGERLL